MTLEQFRITHSILIEHYQYIEANLEGIYASVSGKMLLDGLQDVEKYSLSCIVKEIKKMEKEKSISVFTDDEYIQLQQVFQRRNFWCHSCYYDMVFDRKTGGPKDIKDITIMMNDLREAEHWREILFERKTQLFEKYQKYLISPLC